MLLHLLFHVLCKQRQLHKALCFHYRCVKILSECCHNSQAGKNLGIEIGRIELPVGC